MAAPGKASTSFVDGGLVWIVAHFTPTSPAVGSFFARADALFIARFLLRKEIYWNFGEKIVRCLLLIHGISL